jgi:hypothetical protein
MLRLNSPPTTTATSTNQSLDRNIGSLLPASESRRAPFRSGMTFSWDSRARLWLRLAARGRCL